jgi:hypothetical protein
VDGNRKSKGMGDDGMIIDCLRCDEGEDGKLRGGIVVHYILHGLEFLTVDGGHTDGLTMAISSSSLCIVVQKLQAS